MKKMVKRHTTQQKQRLLTQWQYNKIKYILDDMLPKINTLLDEAKAKAVAEGWDI